MKPRFFTTSWDDGHPLDLRVADLLAEYDCSGTFFVPERNTEGRPVLNAAQLRTLNTRFEIGCHTRDHVRLDRVADHTAVQQIVDGKHFVEDLLGAEARGFCYPGGKYNACVRSAVEAAGFRYARTVTNLSIGVPHDVFRVPTTLQLYPHRVRTYCTNFIRGGNWASRAPMFSISMRNRSLDALLQQMLTHFCQQGGVFHLWGHSWELDQFALWDALERFLQVVQQVVPSECRVDNATAYAHLARS